MAHTLKLYFFGRARPAVFSSEHFFDAADVLTDAIADCAPDAQSFFVKGLFQIVDAYDGKSASAFSYEHGGLGISWQTYPYDTFLDDVTATYPAFPGLDYSLTTNQTKEG